MSGKVLVLMIVFSAAVAGAALYYLQIYGFYQPVAVAEEVHLVAHATDAPQPINVTEFQAIDADSSPIRFRACFRTEASLARLSETYVGLDGQTPRNAPGWFDCFDAAAIAEELDAGTALTFLGQKNIHYGVDRIVAITEDGRGYIWHELNDCGEKAYDGTVVGEACPPREETN